MEKIKYFLKSENTVRIFESFIAFTAMYLKYQ